MNVSEMGALWVSDEAAPIAEQPAKGTGEDTKNLQERDSCSSEDASAPEGVGQDADAADEAAVGHPRVRRICRAANIDVREARASRWMDTVDLLSLRAPQYLQPYLVYAEG
jgi:hypothetical protein